MATNFEVIDDTSPEDLKAGIFRVRVRFPRPFSAAIEEFLRRLQDSGVEVLDLEREVT